MVKVSVIMPAYNCEKFIKHTIQSVQAQTYSDWELIIINDASTDNPLQEAQKYASEDERIKVLDMPLLDTSNHTDNLDTRFVADLVLQVLSYVAEKERKHIKDRQRQGIEVAKAQGKHLGRPRAKYPNNWVEVYTQWKAKEITAVQAQQLLQVPPTTFYKLVNRYMPK